MDALLMQRTSGMRQRCVGALWLVLLLTLSAGCSQAQGVVWAWGDNTYGELGNGSFTGYFIDIGGDIRYGVATPAQASGLYGVIAIASGNIASDGYFSMALKSDGTVWTWGDNSEGQLGNGVFTNSPTFPYTGVATPGPVVGPGGVGFLTGIVAISASGEDSLALRSDGTVWDWGRNDGGQLGDGAFTGNGGPEGQANDTPVQVVGPDGVGFLTDVVAIAAGDSFNLALKSDGTVWAWGYNSEGDLGNGGYVGAPDSPTYNSFATPGQVVGPGGVGFLTDIVAISAGGDFSLALKSDGTVWAWGDNAFCGELGNGTFTGDPNYPGSFGIATPGQVVGPGGVGFLTDVVAITAGNVNGFAIKSDGTVWAWGYNTSGQLGNGTFMGDPIYQENEFDGYALATPGQVVGPDGVGFLTGVVAIAASDSFNMALRSDGTVWAWGDNTVGELGNGTFTGVPQYDLYDGALSGYALATPGQVIGLTGVTAIAPGLAVGPGYPHGALPAPHSPIHTVPFPGGGQTAHAP